MRNLIRVSLMTLLLVAGGAGIGLAAPRHAAAGAQCYTSATAPWAAVGGGVWGNGGFSCNYYGGNAWLYVEVDYAIGGNTSNWGYAGSCQVNYANYYSHGLSCWVPAGYSTAFRTFARTEDTNYVYSYAWSGYRWISVG